MTPAPDTGGTARCGGHPAPTARFVWARDGRGTHDYRPPPHCLRRARRLPDHRCARRCRLARRLWRVAPLNAAPCPRQPRSGNPPNRAKLTADPPAPSPCAARASRVAAGDQSRPSGGRPRRRPQSSPRPLRPSRRPRARRCPRPRRRACRRHRHRHRQVAARPCPVAARCRSGISGSAGASEAGRQATMGPLRKV